MFKDIYRKIESVPIPECGGTGDLYEHIRTGAKVATLKNSDPNKVFMIAFRTTPDNSTGVAHIMEHSVLCGSEKFPLKDPFVELAKGSLNTFLNAMTYPDKTVYPVASCNDKDFMNLMDVYLDAVFHPNIYRQEKIFLQEGWHYETDEEGALVLNGVVYNEMKGAFSSPDSVLERFTLNSLYPHTTYGFESGGDPDCIPDLSYEEFLAFHKKYYHPSNSYIWLCGDMDMEEKLTWIDERYLSAYGRIRVDSEIGKEPPFAVPVYTERSYAVTPEDETENRSYLSVNYVIPEIRDSLTDLAWETVDFVLLSAPGAPLKEELIRAGFGDEIYGGYNAGIRQPYFSVVAKNTEKEKLPAFRKAVEEILSGIIKNGFDRDSLKAALNYLEFKYREEDYGRTPAGLEYGLSALESWLYDQSPWQFLTYQKEFEELKKRMEGRFYEELLASCIVGNSHRSDVVIVPEKGLSEKKDALLKEKLAAYRSSLTEDAYEALCRKAEELETWQEEEDSEERKRCLPVLKLSDISREAEKIRVREQDNVIYSELPTHGIAYLRLIYDLSSFTEEELQLAALLKVLYGELNTASHSYKELSDRILMSTGGVDFTLGSQVLGIEPGVPQPFFPLLSVEIRALKEGIRDGLDLGFEILETTSFEDTGRIADKLMEAKSQAQSMIDCAAHLLAVNRSKSYSEPAARFSDLTGGVAWYDWLCEQAGQAKDPAKLSAFIAKLKNASAKIASCRFDVALGGDTELLSEVNRVLDVFAKPNRSVLSRRTADHCTSVKPLSGLNEGFRTGSMVNYVARTGKYLGPGECYDGAAEVLKIMLNYEYLWNNLRVKGGAYGCMAGFTVSGRGWFVSYRDPNLSETDRVYRELPDWLEKAEISEEKVLKYIIGAIAAQDQPVTASVKAARSLNDYYLKLTDEWNRKNREDILNCTPAKLRAFAKGIRRLFAEENLCAVGQNAKIEENRSMFGSVRELR